MNSIAQSSQLGDKELKAVLKNDKTTFDELLTSSFNSSQLKKDVVSLANELIEKTSMAFQIMVEKIISEEFMTFLEDISDKGISPSRNGYYERKIRSCLGDFNIQIPRARYASFETKLLDKYGHNIGDIESKIIDFYVNGMTESEVVNTLASAANIGISKEKVGEIVRSTIGDALKFNNETIEDCPVVFLDATYSPLKRAYFNRKSVEKSGILVALGITPSGNKKILGFLFGETESIDRWKILLESLKKRGLNHPKLFVTDGLSGMPNAIKEIFPAAKHQRCIVHYQRNLASYVANKDKKQICEEFQNVINQDSKDSAIAEFEKFKNFWSVKYKCMAGMLNETDDNIFTFFDFPVQIKKAIYTSNAIEGFNAKLKRETKKRIQSNSEDNATIITTHICKSYNNSCGRRLLTGLINVDAATRNKLGFNF